MVLYRGQMNPGSRDSEVSFSSESSRVSPEGLNMGPCVNQLTLQDHSWLWRRDHRAIHGVSESMGETVVGVDTDVRNWWI